MKYIIIVLLLVIVRKFEADELCKEYRGKKDPRECCEVLPPVANDSIVGKCRNLYAEQSNKAREMRVAHGCCVSECTLNDTQVYKGNGAIDKELLLKLFLDRSDPAWINQLPKVIDKCFKLGENFTDEFTTTYKSEPIFTGAKVCHPISGFMLGCIQNRAYLNCPDSQFIQDPKCIEFKVYIKNGCTIDYLK